MLICFSDVNWTSFFQMIEAFAGIATVGTFLFLFFKDKAKQAQINKLSDISESLKAQTESINKFVDLQSQQLNIINKANSYSGETKDKLALIEEQKLLLSVRPRIVINSTTCIGHQGEIEVNIRNLGETATLVAFEVTNGDLLSHSEHLPYTLEKDQKRKIYLRTKDRSNSNFASFRLEIKYIDRLENEYKLVIQKDGIGGSKIMEDILISKKEFL